MNSHKTKNKTLPNATETSRERIPASGWICPVFVESNAKTGYALNAIEYQG